MYDCIWSINQNDFFRKLNIKNKNTDVIFKVYFLVLRTCLKSQLLELRIETVVSHYWYLPYHGLHIRCVLCYLLQQPKSKNQSVGSHKLKFPLVSTKQWKSNLAADLANSRFRINSYSKCSWLKSITTHFTKCLPEFVVL